MTSFIAHKREKEGNIEVQSLEDHLNGVAELAANYASNINCSSIGRLQGLLHDAGKMSEDFQNYIWGENEMRPGEIDHSYAGARYLLELVALMEDRGAKETAELIARTIISHHGLHDWIDSGGHDYFRERSRKEERFREIRGNYKALNMDEELNVLLNQAIPEYKTLCNKARSMAMEQNKLNKVSLFFYMGMIERLLQSILVDSDRTDTANFCNDYRTDLQLPPDLWEQFGEKVEKYSHDLEENDNPISVLRSDISNRCVQFTDHEAHICRMIVPTGGGKTISSLRYAVNYCRRYKKSHIFYVAPFMSILEQNSDVFRTILGEEFVLEHHSGIFSEIENTDELAQFELRAGKWDSPVITTTMVQFLNAFYGGRMDSVRRFHELCNSVIIVDEVQSIPTKCVHLFNLGMNFISGIGGSCVVLCSATQPAFDKVGYPVLLDQNYNMVGDYKKDFLAFKRTRIIPVDNLQGKSYVEAAIFCKQKFEENGSVLFIVNTKAAAIQLYNQPTEMINPSEAQIIYLSTNLCPARRRRIIESVRKMLHDHQAMICISTQLIEAGVDISFPCVIRSLAGLDSVAQAAGRCNRNNELNRCCDVWLIHLKDENTGMISDIRAAQNASKQIIWNCPDKDYMDVEVQNAYFKVFYREKSEELSYPVVDTEMKTNLVKMLSTNPLRCSQRMQDNSKKFYVQAFKSAAEKFQVIDNSTVSVIVPDNQEAKNIIAELRTGVEGKNAITLFRKAQQYTIEIFGPIKQKLIERHAIELLPCNVYVLDERFYDEFVGLKMKGDPMDLLMF